MSSDELCHDRTNYHTPKKSFVKASHKQAKELSQYYAYITVEHNNYNCTHFSDVILSV